MGELASLFFIVLLVYLLQCVSWVPPQAVAFTLGLRGRGKRRRHGFVWHAFDTAAFFANPLPPLNPLVMVQWPAFELSPDGIRFPDQEGKVISIAWDKLTVKHSEAKLWCNGLLAFKGSELQVGRYAQLFAQLQRARRSQRDQIIQDWLRKTMSIQAASRRVRIFVRRSCWLRMIANLQFVFLFLLAPLGFERFGTGILWRAILMLVAISLAITVEFWMVHKSTLPQAESKDSRFKAGLTILLSPMAAIRACDAAARDFLSGYHPLAVAGALTKPEEFRRFAAEQLRLCRFGDSLTHEYQARLQKLMEQAVRQQGIDPEELLRPPDPQSGCVLYCPRCLAQYTKERAECSDCGYEGLEALV